MTLIFTASTTRALLSAVAPFAPLPGGYLTFPVVEPEAPRRPAPAPAPLPRREYEYDEIEMHLLRESTRSRAWSEALGGGIADESAAPILLGAATTGFAPRPRAQTARSRTRSFTARLVALSRGPQQTGVVVPTIAEESERLLEGVKAARVSFASRTRRAFNGVFGPALGGPNRGEYARLGGRD